MRTFFGLWAMALCVVPAPAAAQGCTFTVSRTNIVAGPEGPIFASIEVTASAPVCQWSSSTAAAWITVNTSLRTGSGNEFVTLSANSSGATRTATVTVAGNLINVTQQTTPCVTSLVPNALEFPYPGFGDPAEQRKNVTVTAPADCHWGHSPWPINAFPSLALGGAGTKVVTVGIITLFPGQGNTLDLGIGSLPLTLTRLDPPCVFTVTPASPPPVSVNGGSGILTVSGAGTDCSFTASSTGASISQSSGSAPATISYTLGPNPGAFQRSVNITLPNVTVAVPQNGAPARTDVESVVFGAVVSSRKILNLSPPEEVQLTIDEQPGSAWTVTVDSPWLVVTPTSGAGPATLQVSVDAAAVEAAPINLFNTALVSIGAAFAPATAVKTLSASLRVAIAGQSLAPTGVFDTPLNNTMGASGAIPVTGWALDDIDVARIQIYRDPVPGEGGAEIYIGDATRVKGARPDVAQIWRHMPQSRRAGWGYMLLSNVLPGGGNGTFTFSAYVDDVDGHRVFLGRRTATFDNAGATKPFGTIDTPAQGQTVSGTILNQGWALTPAGKAIPFDGSTIGVYVDGGLLSSVSAYNHPRPDVTQLFPNLANSDGPGALLAIDTTLLADGVHTIAWGVTDDAGSAEGLGSRYFTVQNGSSSVVEATANAARSAGSVARLPALKTDVWSREGMDDTGWATRVETDAMGYRTLRVTRGQRVELFLDPMLQASCGTFEGHLLTGDVAGPLPIGASLDRRLGIFRWQPTPQFKGAFNFVFVQRGCDGRERRLPVSVVIGR